MPSFVAASSSTFFSSRTENVLKHPLHVEVYEIIFPTSHHMHETGSEQESCANFRLRNAEWFCHISLHGSSKLMILDALESRFEGASEY
jgi:hypothetical protein